MQGKGQAKSDKQLDEMLFDAATKHNLSLVNELLGKGANPNYVKVTNGDGWYPGDTHTALYTAISQDVGDQKNFNDVVEALIKKGANTNFKARRGAWNHWEDYPMFNEVVHALSKFKMSGQKIRLIQMFVKGGVDINQNQSHGRSKNWKAYRSNTNFIFRMMDMNGMRSKLRQLARMEVDTKEMSEFVQKREKQLKSQFYKQYKIQEKPQQPRNAEHNNLNEQQNENQKQKQKQQPDISLIEALVKFGANVNSSTSYHYWSNQNSRYDEADDEECVAQNSYQTILHRAIMNNAVKLVKVLLQKGADVSKKCTFSVQVPLYPKNWSDNLKKRKIKQNEMDLKEAEKNKEELKKITNQWADLESVQYSIFKAKQYSVETDNPIMKYEDRNLSCLEIAERLNADKEIIEILKNQKPPNQV